MSPNLNLLFSRRWLPAAEKSRRFVPPGCAGYSRNQLEELNKFVQSYGAGGLLTFSLGVTAGDLSNITMDMVKSVAAKYMTLEQVKQIAELLSAKPGDLLLVIAGAPKVVDKSLGELRKEMGQRLKLADPDLFAFAFVVNFPLFAWNEETKRWDPEHHPLSGPGLKMCRYWKKIRGKYVLIVTTLFATVLRWPVEPSYSHSRTTVSHFPLPWL